MRTALYARVSTDEQAKGFSLPTQMEACRKYAVERGYTVVGEFKDDYTGTELDRPGLNEMRQLMEASGFERLIVYDLDRLARGVAHQYIFEQEAARANVQIEYVLGQYAASPEGDLMKHVKAAIAEYENQQRVERSRRGKEGKARAGFVIMPAGRSPFGYTYLPGKHKGAIEINEAQAVVVRLIYKWITLDGMSSYAIAKKLWQEGILSKGDFSSVVMKKGGRGEWSPSTVRRIISNTVYKGVWYYGKTRRRKVNGKTSYKDRPESEWIAVAVPAIVDAETWEWAQRCLAKNKQNATRNTKHFYLLRGMVFCPCGRRWTCRYKNYLKRAYYRCPSTEAEPWRERCAMPGGILQEKLEKAVWDAVCTFLQNPSNLRDEIARRRAEVASIYGQKEMRLQAIEAAMAEIDRKMGILLDQMLTDGFAKTVVEQRKNELVTQKNDLVVEAEQVRADMRSATITPEHEQEILTLAKTVSRGLKNLTLEERRHLLELLNLRVDVQTQTKMIVSGIISSTFVNIASA